MSSSNEKTIRFYLVENVSSAIARGLRQQNINVTTTDENGLIGVTDEQLEFAISQNRAIFTHDADFLRLHKKGLQHKGIVYCSQKKLKSISTGEIVTALKRIHLSTTSELMSNHVEFI